MTRTRLIALVVAAAALAWVAAIALASRTPEAVKAPGGRISVNLDDYRFSVERIRVRPGPFRMEVRNVGRVPHAVVLIREDSGGEAGRVITRKPGETGVLDIEKVNRGTYRFLCPLSHHEDLGMWGTLVVR